MTFSHIVPVQIASAAVIAFGLLIPGSAAYALDDEAQIKLGESEYMSNCAACHGPHGMGDGPVAEVLSTKPSDLTQISKKFEGKFPREHIYAVVDGQKMINPHGDRLMPVWGPRYWSLAEQRAGEVPHDVDAAAMVHGRITALVRYLESIQAP
ncbi:MAG: cytochrome c [Rhodobacter sp.]|nr:cytochrome c [Rhodobacter sp.]